jgi:hypothetical protein
MSNFGPGGTYVAPNGDIIGMGSNFYWNYSNSQPTAATVAPTPAPAPAPVFNLTSPNTIGSTVMMAYGTGRLGGQNIWTTGIVASPDATQTGLVTGMWAFCEPADPDEPIRIQKLWANGTQFYDFSVNPTAGLAVANLTPDAQSALDACIASMVLHTGGPGELADATMVSILGEANVPANRGLRTITFIDFPVLISGNAIPTISCLFRRTDTILVRVDTCFQKIIDRYILRTGVSISFDTDGIDDECYGATISDQGTAVDVLTRHKDIYNYQILDGDPITIVRKPISSSLVIDLEVAEADVDRANGAPAVPSTRVNPSQLPIGINFQFPNVDTDFDTGMEPALHEGTAASTVITSVQSIFGTDNTTAREMAFDLLYRLRAKALRFPIELDNVVTEVSDVIRLTTNEGDAYTILVEEATYTKSRATGIQGLALLTEAGADINGGMSLNGGRRNIPRVVLLLNFPGANGSTIFTDESPAHHGNATVIGDVQVDTTQYKFGGSSGLFDGDDALNFADSPDWHLTAVNSSRNGRFTVEDWIRPTSIVSTAGFIVGQWGNLEPFGPSVDLSWILWQNDDELVFSYSVGGVDNNELLRGGTLAANRWNAAAVDYDGTTARLYINGIVVDSAVISNLSFADGTKPLAIGANSDNFAGFFSGNMDRLIITLNTAKYAGSYIIGNLGFLMEGSSTASFSAGGVGIFTSAGAASVTFTSSSDDDDIFLLLL